MRTGSAAALLDRGPDRRRQVRPLEAAGGPAVGDGRGLHPAILAATRGAGRRGSGGPGVRVRRRAAVPEPAQHPGEPGGPVYGRRRWRPPRRGTARPSRRSPRPGRRRWPARRRPRRRRAASAGRPAAPGCRPRRRAAGARRAGRAAPSARPRRRSPRGCSAPSSRATSMRESSWRDQWSCRARRRASRSPYAAASSASQGRRGAVLDRADHAEDGGAGWRVSVVMSSTLGIRRAPICRRGAGLAVPAQGRRRPARLRPESDVPAAAAAYARGVDVPGFVLRMKRRWVANGLPDYPLWIAALIDSVRAGHRGGRCRPAPRDAWLPASGWPRSRWSRGSPSCGARRPPGRVRGADRRRVLVADEVYPVEYEFGAVPARPCGRPRDRGGRALARRRGDGRRRGGDRRGLA